MAIEVKRRGEASADVVWQRYTTPALWSRWAPQIRGAAFDTENITPGQQGTVRAWPAGSVEVRIVDVDHAQMRWTWEVTSVHPVRMEHGVDPLPDGGSVAWMRADLPGPLGVLYSPIAGLALRRLVSADAL